MVMRLDLGDSHKKRFAWIARVKKFQRHVCDAVRAIALEIDAVVVFIKYIAVVAVRGEFQYVGGAPEAGIASAQLARDRGDGVIDGRRLFKLTIAGQMPFSDIGRLITSLLDVVRQRFDALGKHDIVAETAGFRRISAGLKQSAAGPAYWLRGKGVVKFDALPGQFIQAGGDIQRLAEAAACIPTLLIGEIKKNIVGHNVKPPFVRPL